VGSGRSVHRWRPAPARLDARQAIRCVSHATLRRLPDAVARCTADRCGRGCRAGRAAHSGAGRTERRSRRCGVRRRRQVHRAVSPVTKRSSWAMTAAAVRRSASPEGPRHGPPQRGPDEIHLRAIAGLRSARSRRMLAHESVPRARENRVSGLLIARPPPHVHARSGRLGIGAAAATPSRGCRPEYEASTPPCRPAPGRSPRGPSRCALSAVCAEMS